jgi:hypothetical protein
MWRGMSPVEIEDFWCSASPPVEAVYFDDEGGFASFFVLMKDGTVTAHLDNQARANIQVLRDALLYFLT